MKMLLTIEYKGTNFAGWQVQPGKRTVQGEIEKALQNIFGQKIQIFGSGRTDSGVHAIGQTAHFNGASSVFNKFIVNDKLNKEKLMLAINANLPVDVKVLKLKKVASHFHARFNVKEKIYLYKLQTNTNIASPLTAGLVGTCKKSLDIQKMCDGSKFLIGEHDFTSFSSTKTEVEDFVRTINYIKIRKESDIVTFEISGNGFLYNMVRIIVGTLVDVGTGKIEPEKIKTILESKSRSCASKTAPAEGLYLKKVKY
jgi:tRNA pseudouridine38-40 synthase